ncbi:unnamed protein product, partial [Cylicocyclus nassatus]
MARIAQTSSVAPCGKRRTCNGTLMKFFTFNCALHVTLSAYYRLFQTEYYESELKLTVLPLFLAVFPQ